MNEHRNITIETEHGPIVVQFRDDVHADVWNIGSSEAGYLSSYTPFTERGSEFTILASMKREGDEWVFDNWKNIQYSDYRRAAISEARYQRFERLISEAITGWVRDHQDEFKQATERNKKVDLQLLRDIARSKVEEANRALIEATDQLAQRLEDLDAVERALKAVAT